MEKFKKIHIEETEKIKVDHTELIRIMEKKINSQKREY
jgi:hypothetical protein